MAAFGWQVAVGERRTEYRLRAHGSRIELVAPGGETLTRQLGPGLGSVAVPGTPLRLETRSARVESEVYRAGASFAGGYRVALRVALLTGLLVLVAAIRSWAVSGEVSLPVGLGALILVGLAFALWRLISPVGTTWTECRLVGPDSASSSFLVAHRPLTGSRVAGRGEIGSLPGAPRWESNPGAPIEIVRFSPLEETRATTPLRSPVRQVAFGLAMAAIVGVVLAVLPGFAWREGINPIAPWALAAALAVMPVLIAGTLEP